MDKLREDNNISFYDYWLWRFIRRLYLTLQFKIKQ